MLIYLTGRGEIEIEIFGKYEKTIDIQMAQIARLMAFSAI